MPQLSNEQVSEYYKKQYGVVNPVDQAIGVDSGDILKKGQSFEKLNDEFLSRYQSVVDKVASDNADAIAKAQREYDKDLTVFQRYLDEKLIGEQEFQDARTKLYAIEQSKIQKLQDEENKKYKDEAGKLFDDLISGKPKEFAKSLQHDLMEAVLAPIKNIFEQMLGGTLASISHAASAAVWRCGWCRWRNLGRHTRSSWWTRCGLRRTYWAGRNCGMVAGTGRRWSIGRCGRAVRRRFRWASRRGDAGNERPCGHRKYLRVSGDSRRGAAWLNHG